MNWSYILLLVSIGNSFNISCATKKSKSVTTVIDTKWNSSPPILEIAEYLAEEDPRLFWQFVDSVSSLQPALSELGTEKDKYEKALNEAGKLLSTAQLDLLKMSLSLHVYSPRVEMYHQIAVDRNVTCKNGVELPDQIICCPKKLKEFLDNEPNKDSKTEQLETFRLDHHYPGAINGSTTAILYSELGTEEFVEFHKLLKRYVSSGKLDYVVRHYIKDGPNRRVRLSGYGVELQMKSTEYKVQDDTKVSSSDGADGQPEDEGDDEEVAGFNFAKLKKLYPDQKSNLDKLRLELLESSNEMAPLKVWQFQELSLQAAQRILSAPLDEAISVLTHIAQNFPMQARSLVNTVVDSKMKSEMKQNQENFATILNLQPSDSAIFINGLFYEVENIDMVTLLDIIRQELKIMEGLHKIGVTEKKALNKLLALDLPLLSGTSNEYAIDIRDSAINWINDIEKDSQFKRWSTSYLDLLRPTFPGMLRSIRRNMYNLVVLGDPSKKDVWPLIKMIESFNLHTAPLRIGIVFTVNPKATGTNDGGVALLNAFNYISETKTPIAALSFITDVYNAIKDDDHDVLAGNVYKVLRRKYPEAPVDDILGSDTDYDTGRKLAEEFLERSGFSVLPQVLLNGVPLPSSSLNSEDFEDAVFSEVIHQTPTLQKATYKGELVDSMDVVDYLMNQPNVMPRLNDRVLSLEKIRSLNLMDPLADAFFSNMKYASISKGKKASQDLTDDVHLLTNWIVTDLSTLRGRNLLGAALDHMKNSGKIRVAFISNNNLNKKGERIITPLDRLVVGALLSLPSDQAASRIKRLLIEYDDVSNGRKTHKDYDLENVDWDKVAEMFSTHQTFINEVAGLAPGQHAIVSNGRLLGPLNDDEQFGSDDFNLLERFSLSSHVDKIHNALTENSDDLDLTSNVLMKAVSILVARPTSKSRFDIPFYKDEHSTIKLEAKSKSEPAFDINVIVDPVSRAAQKVGPILNLVKQVVNCDIRVFLNCVEKNSDMPLKSFYRYVIEPELSFTSDGQMASGPMAKFLNMPATPLLTQNMHVPDNWLVESVATPYDLDNIRLEEVETNVHSQFELENLLLEGHCFEATMGNPPRGLQITLGTESQPVSVDTIVMANLGYFQLKANPGAWILRLRQGRSADIYDITSHEGSDTPANSKDIKVLISSFKSHVLKLRVTKKPEKAGVDLLGEDDYGNHPGLWDSITSTFSGSSGQKDDEEETETINIFSVASGHLYERFLRIMMLSVLKNTKSPVKFWFLKNYLSPTFKDFLPRMAKEYKFQYELVQYKWPRWLHQQTEKQRIIWGYKILFLDVLFPLDVKKIIFVDADQVVRADMKELVDLDLGGAPYGYTPFCESRKEMDGFRFWKQGYWRNHLQGRSYHISALYVVDLKRFRRIAAGDRLRGQYQSLSQDPNSLSNLDQDLPNNMIHQVAIKSLPQEWLWCETWCDDNSKKRAKTIDLCNNPLTKEAKLTAAMRIVNEWKDYDAEIKSLQLKLGATEDHEEEEHDEEDEKEGAGAGERLDLPMYDQHNIHSEL